MPELTGRCGSARSPQAPTRPGRLRQGRHRADRHRRQRRARLPAVVAGRRRDHAGRRRRARRGRQDRRGDGAAVPEAAAAGIVDIVNENMLGGLRLVRVQQGFDPRDFALVAFGGAGPLHANALGRLTGAWPVIVPPSPGVLCALGDATTAAATSRRAPCAPVRRPHRRRPGHDPARAGRRRRAAAGRPGRPETRR